MQTLVVELPDEAVSALEELVRLLGGVARRGEPAELPAEDDYPISAARARGGSSWDLPKWRPDEDDRFMAFLGLLDDDQARVVDAMVRLGRATSQQVQEAAGVDKAIGPMLGANGISLRLRQVFRRPFWGWDKPEYVVEGDTAAMFKRCLERTGRV